MKTLLLLAILSFVLISLTGCATQDRLDALGHPVTHLVLDPQGCVPATFEIRLRRLLATREKKDKVFSVIGSEPPERVWDAAFFDRYYRVFDGQSTNVPSETRAEWKRNYRLSAETYVISAEDENHIILYFDGSGRLWQYDHFPIR